MTTAASLEEIGERSASLQLDRVERGSVKPRDGRVTKIHLTLPDYVVIFGYFIVVLLVGLHFRKKQKAAKDYFAGGHQVPWWLAGISHYMSSFSAFTFIAYSQIAYTYGFVAITLFWTTTPACILGRTYLRTPLAASPRDHSGGIP